MPPAVMDPPLPESSSVLSFSSDIVFQGTEPDNRRFGNLRGLQWRINLGVLPSSSIDDLRRATANSRRRYSGQFKDHFLLVFFFFYDVAIFFNPMFGVCIIVSLKVDAYLRGLLLVVGILAKIISEFEITSLVLMINLASSYVISYFYRHYV